MAWQSKRKLFGLPLVSAGFYAEGIIALGFSGYGVITIAQFGVGIISITQFGIGVISICQFGLGFCTIAQGGIGLIFSFGQAVLGFIATGDSAAGYYTIKHSYNLKNNIPLLLDQVKANPEPLIIWIAFLLIISAFLIKQRDKLTFRMSPLDLFRKKIQHKDVRVRLKALKKINDTRELQNIAIKDPSDLMRKGAVDKIHDETVLTGLAKNNANQSLRARIIKKIKTETALTDIAKTIYDTNILHLVIKKISNRDMLLDIARNAVSSNYRIGAILKLQGSSEAHYEKLALREKDPTVLKTILKKITSRDLLENIITSASAPEAKIMALIKIKNPGTDLLMRIVQSESSIRVTQQAVSRISDQKVLFDIVLSNQHLALKKTAILHLENKKYLRSLEERKIDETITGLISKRLKETEPVYHEYKITIDCPYCSQPVFINGPLRTVSCTSCLSETFLNKSFWKHIKKAGFGITTMLSQNNLLIEKSKSLPRCRKCDELLETDDVPNNSKKAITCFSCKTENSSLQIPDWLSFYSNGEHIFCAESENFSDDDKKSELKPVSISCIKCGAPLEVTAATPRNATCTYCNTVQYLPDPLWLSIHPVKTKQSWFIRFNFRENKKG